MAIRRALTKLGVRRKVIPQRLADQVVELTGLEHPVPGEQLEHALAALREADQVVLYFQRWRPWQDTWSWIDGSGWELDWTSPWKTLVSHSHRQASEAARTQAPEEAAVVTIEWMAETDWPTE